VLSASYRRKTFWNIPFHSAVGFSILADSLAASVSSARFADPVETTFNSIQLKPLVCKDL
jgi:hypothetical protein